MGIQLQNVNYIYSPGTAFEKHALKNISLDIKDGEFLGLIGHTGSGKSTLTQLLNGLVKATSGRILFHGENIYQEKYNMRKLRGKVGLVFQYPEHQLFEAAVIKDVEFGPKNLGFSKEEARMRAEQALKDVGLQEEFFELSPFELSGGQKRRVAIAGVLAMEPEVLILDEPTAALDPLGKEEILELVKYLQKDKKITVILVSHSMEEVAKYVDKLIVLNRGEIVFHDTPKEVFKQYKKLEKINLAAPQITYIMNDLKDNGIPVSTDAITVNEAKNALLDWAKGEGLIP
ncbi:energy-coupling factor transporter ATPase [[Clostridium] polysaccharolyticum]|uniref:Energy-coupling factor transporter ATP-binding protein EcfA2 n=1 Tax=[Clostridium] polysaccharolyticum TaxID=29364 RepID=A0A1I0DR87_9FIRM|nr:energy-coupling factor transporter ATPase [[Clostridium] polysaccharolyticum]SET35080.1 energy-coupling factor transport system ATP-binding protein [[Clostridium] polysaccharolyticum]